MKHLLAFDVESNGLHGAAFAVGGVILDEQGNEVDTFFARAPDPTDLDPWVRDNVLPGLPPEPTHSNARAMRDAFWEWFMSQLDVLVLADCAWPVEAGFLAACIADSKARAWSGPYPLHEVATLLLAAGMDPHASYAPCVLDPLELQRHRAHHPVDDARVSARAARLALARIAARREGRPEPFGSGTIARLAAHCARAAHEVNNVYNDAIGDVLVPAWGDLTDAQREGAIRGAEHALAGGSPEDSHNLWMETRIAEGWVYGPTKNFAAKSSPCLIPYSELPESQRRKDAQFQAVVRAVAQALT